LGSDRRQVHNAVSNEATKLADALGAAIHARDVVAIRKIYADEIVVWHGSTGQAQTKDKNAELLAAVFKVASRLEYVDIRRHVIDGGIVQQHRLIGRFADGRSMPDLNACLVIKVRDGKIIRIDEYFDGATYAEVWTLLATAAGV
jgi:ketosteroid isomerase-like protein